jgi:hypothetical protein
MLIFKAAIGDGRRQDFVVVVEEGGIDDPPVGEGHGVMEVRERL